MRSHVHFAAMGGHLDLLMWARNNGCPCDEQNVVRMYAAQYGHVDVFRWALVHNCPSNDCTCTIAARGRHLEVLRCAREYHCPWDAWTCAYAAQVGIGVEVGAGAMLPMGPDDASFPPMYTGTTRWRHGRGRTVAPDSPPRPGRSTLLIMSMRLTGKVIGRHFHSTRRARIAIIRCPRCE